MIGLKNSRHFFIQSEVQPKPIVTRSHAFSRALRKLPVITSSFDWYTVLSVSFVIGWSNYFGLVLRQSIENRSMWNAKFFITGQVATSIGSYM